MLLEVLNRMSQETPSADSPSDWRQEYLDLKGDTLSPCQQLVLKQGPRSLSQAWALQAMKNDYKKILKL